MVGRTGVVSRHASGKVSLGYTTDGRKATVVWEPVSGGFIETVFDSDGGISTREMYREEADVTGRISARVASASVNAGIEETIEGDFSDVKLEKGCPSCGKQALSLWRGSDGEKSGAIPVMPIYECTGCWGRGYYLTDAYLNHLVSTCREMFSAAEQHEMGADRAAFTSELRGYIIRIFASKRIIEIK